MDFTAFSRHVTAQLESDITDYIGACQLPSPLHEASLYAITNGGKRVRPLLIASSYATVISSNPPSHFDKPLDFTTFPVGIRQAMIAVELLHGYSLVHDDLPCMDDDDLRRGKPTTHIKFGEATALLAGDVLQTLAFEAFCHPHFIEINWKLGQHLWHIFTPCARRMVMGQMLDLNGEKKLLTQPELEAIHRDKTGALIEASVLMGLACAQVHYEKINPNHYQALQNFAQHIGLAFQVQDDILDVTSNTEQIGKPAHSDEKLNKSTYVKLLGVDEAKDYAQRLFDIAKQAVIDEFGDHNYLVDLANWLWARDK